MTTVCTIRPFIARVWRFALAGILTALVVATVWPGVLGTVADGPNWRFNAWVSPLMVRCLAIAGLCATLLAAMAVLMWRLAAKRRRSRPAGLGQEGSAMIEFALVLPIALMLSLIMAQTSLLMAGNLCVHYAAYCAARSAAVVVPSNPSGVYAEHADDPVFDTMAPNVFPVPAEKLARIKQAAVWAVMPVSANREDMPSGDPRLVAGVRKFFASYPGAAEPSWVAGLGQRLQYANEYTEVEVERDASALGNLPAQGLTVIGEHEDIKVTVTHTFYLSIPYAASIFQTVGSVVLPFGTGEYGMPIKAYSRLTNEGVRDWVDMDDLSAP